MEIEIRQGSILDAGTESIVNPANSSGKMGGGLAKVLRNALGYVVQEEAVSKAPIPVGAAVVTSGGESSFRGVIHAPTMEKPSEPTTPARVKAATRAAIELADQEGFGSVGIPGMGTGTGKVTPEDAAKAMFDAISELSARYLYRIVLIDINENMISAWEKEKKSRRL